MQCPYCKKKLKEISRDSNLYIEGDLIRRKCKSCKKIFVTVEKFIKEETKHTIALKGELSDCKRLKIERIPQVHLNWFGKNKENKENK